MKASDLFIEALQSEGVEFILGFPGEENLDFLDSLSRSSIRLILTRHEQAAGFMASTHGRLTGKAGIFLSTPGPGATNERDPLFLGNATLWSGDFVHRAVEAADLTVNIGHGVVEKLPFFMKASGVQVVHLNFSTAEVDPVYFPQVEVVGDIANSVWKIGEGLEKQAHWDFSRFLEVRAAGEAHVLEGADDARFPIYPQRLVADVRRIMDSRDIIALDTGVYKIWFARNYEAHSPNTVLLDNALATMGAGLPSAIASKLVFADRQVMAIWGDGGFMINSQENETAVRPGLHVVVLILRGDESGDGRCGCH